jgi:hypothetical protein
MLAVAQGPRPVASVQPFPDCPGRENPPPLVEWSGLLPRQTADFLRRLSPKARRHVVVLMGVFKEVQALASAGRQLHSYLQELPAALWDCRITAREAVRAKEEIFQTISSLRQKINLASEEVCLTLPRNRSTQMEETSYGQIPD